MRVVHVTIVASIIRVDIVAARMAALSATVGMPTASMAAMLNVCVNLGVQVHRPSMRRVEWRSTRPRRRPMPGYRVAVGTMQQGAGRRLP